MNVTRWSAAVLAALLVQPPAGPARAQDARQASPRFPLTVDSIMRGPKLVGHPPNALRFSGDSRDLFFEWRQRDEDADQATTYVVPREGGTPRRLSEDERRLAPPEAGGWDQARRRIAFRDEGDIVVVDTVARRRRQLTRTSAAESSPRWARRDTHVTFVRDNGVHVVPVTGEGDVLVQLLEAGPAKPEPRLTDSQRFLKEEEKRLLEAARKEAERRQRGEDRRKKAAPPRLETEKGQVADAVLAGNDRYVYVLLTEKADGARVADMPDYVNESGYVETSATRTKVGDAQDKRRLAVFDLQEKKTAWVSGAFAGPPPSPRPAPSPSASVAASPAPSPSPAPTPEPSPSAPPPPPPSPSASPAPASATPARKDEFREVRWNLPVLSADGSVAVVSVKSADNKDRWVLAVQPGGETKVLFHERDEAWIRDMSSGPYGEANFGLLSDGRTAWFLSEKDGYNHLYVVDALAGGPPRQLTSGKWEITYAQLTPSRRAFLLTTTEAHAGERQVYTLPLTGGARTRITAGVGSHDVVLAPDERTMATIHSTSNRPPEVFVGAPRADAAPRQVTTSPTPQWLAGPWVEPRLVSFRARDGVMVPARLYTPEMLGAERDPRRPAVVFIHGAGYLQNAHRYWSTYYREYMFHHLLASRGYVVLDIDYRGSAGYGRDWRTAIYRHMGGKDHQDIVDGAKYLVAEHGVDPARLGVYGGSYGGFLTLMAMFTAPGTYAAGAALRPVTDWAHYNHPYTSNILNVPQDDAEAYRRSSPIHFAEGLQGALLILHGMVDDNVHFQDSVRLAQRLIELRKDDWEMAAYPVERHAFEEETSWADEYWRILRLFEERVRGVPRPKREGPPPAP